MHKVKHQQGVIIILVALMLRILVTFLLYSLKLSLIYLRHQEIKLAAQAGAHSGAIHLEEETNIIEQFVARAISNNIDTKYNQIRFSIYTGWWENDYHLFYPNHIRNNAIMVEVTDPRDNFLTKAIGYKYGNDVFTINYDNHSNNVEKTSK